MKKNLVFNKAIFTVILLNIAQIGLLIGIMTYQYFKDATIFIAFNSETIAFILIVFTSFLNSLISIKDIHKLGIINSRNNMLQETLSQLEDLNKTLRGQRHDFMNHLQVVYGLIDLEEFKDTKEYIEKVYNDIQKVSRVMRTSNPALNALLQAKILTCEKKGIEARLDINTQFNQLRIPVWEFCRVIANLIDNAIFALENSPTTICTQLNQHVHEKYMQIELYEDIKSYYFCIKDNASALTANNIEKIFDAGFTTKGNKGDGMGLAITKDTLHKYGGDIKAYINNGITVFEGVIPKCVSQISS